MANVGKIGLEKT